MRVLPISVRWLAVAAAVLLPLAILHFVLPAQTARGKFAAQPTAGDQTPDQTRAEALAMADSRVQADIGGRRAEVFGVHAVGAQFTANSAACAQADCRQVDIYDFDSNAAVTVIVDLDAGLVRDVLYQPGVHPAPNKKLYDRAIQIALAAPEVNRELRYQPAAASLNFMDGGLVGTACDQGHLCLAATVPDGKSLVWIVVDLTSAKLAGIVRTPAQPDTAGLGSAPSAVTTCPISGTVARDGWTLSYETTPTDGFRVYDVAYQGVEVLKSAKIVEWHVDYGSSGFVDPTGCGSPIPAVGETEITDTLDISDVVGFEVRQNFQMMHWGNMCNYRYTQHYQFFDDGRFRIVGKAYGKGCSNTGMYRPLMRLDIGVAGAGGDSFAVWDGSEWQQPDVEGWWPQTANYTPEGYQWRVTDAATGRGYFIEPGQGQFGDGGRGDFAYIYATRHQALQGDTDTGSIGPCCNDDQHQGPDAYINGESIGAQDLVLWYIPQTQTEVALGSNYCWTITAGPPAETYPCASGPMFVPLQLQLQQTYFPVINR